MAAANAQLLSEKLDQAAQLLKKHKIDLWITFVRETMLLHDSSFPLVCPFDMVWQSAFLITHKGDRISIVGRYDVENLKRTGAYSEIIPYDGSIRPALITAIKKAKPMRLAINTSESDPAADGLTHGMHALLMGILSDGVPTTAPPSSARAGIVMAIRHMAY